MQKHDVEVRYSAITTLISDGVSPGTIYTGHKARELLMLLHRPLQQSLSVASSIWNGKIILRK